MRYIATLCAVWLVWGSLLAVKNCQAAGVDLALVPAYVMAGLQQYEQNGYEEAVHTWFADSPYSNAATVASNNSFFKNIELLAGAYQSYDVLMTKQTATSNAVYVRINYERLPGYVMFTSTLNKGQWVLNRLALDRMQRFGN